MRNKKQVNKNSVNSPPDNEYNFPLKRQYNNSNFKMKKTYFQPKLKQHGNLIDNTMMWGGSSD